MLKEQKIGNVSCIIAEFGSGDILVTDLMGEDWAGIAFNNHEKREVGTVDESWKGKNTDELKPDMILSFTNQLSIDVVIEKLLEAKNNLSQLHILIASSDKISNR